MWAWRTPSVLHPRGEGWCWACLPGAAGDGGAGGLDETFLGGWKAQLAAAKFLRIKNKNAAAPTKYLSPAKVHPDDVGHPKEITFHAVDDSSEGSLESKAQIASTPTRAAVAGEAKPPRLGEVTKALAAAWRELDDDARAPFDARAAEERERYAREKERIANTWAG